MKDGSLHWKNRDLTGQTFGHLIALHPSHSDGKKMRWVFRCGCGAIVTKVGADVTKAIKKGQTPSCGCLTVRIQQEQHVTHGMSKHPIYAVWRSMIDRCRLPSHQAWKNYGARGITVCPEWQASFEQFWDDMGPTYRPGLTLDRRENSSGYSPTNCRWVSRTVQGRNRRGNHLICTPWGDTTVSEAAEKSGIRYTTILYRLAAGWTPEDSVTRKPNPANRKSMTSSTLGRGTGL